MLKEGIYEKLINKELDDEIKQADDQVDAYKEPLDEAESPSVFGDYAGKAVAKALAAMQDNGASLDQQAEMLNEIMDVLAKHIPEKDASKQHIVEKDGKAQVLNAVINKQNSLFVTSKKKPNRPETSIAHSSLFTGANNEPNLYQEFKMEIRTCDRIDFLVSFIKWSGLRLMIDDLIDFTKRGGKLRIITTTYMGATEPRAIAELSHLPNTEIKISYDTKRTRLHAKTYVFYRNTGYTTAYIGSSNISNAAMSAGLEWNMKITEQDLPETFKKSMLLLTRTGTHRISKRTHQIISIGYRMQLMQSEEKALLRSNHSITLISIHIHFSRKFWIKLKQKENFAGIIRI